MKINGKAAASGSIVIAETETPSVIFPWGECELVFKDVGPQRVEFDASANRLTFHGFNNPVGDFWNTTVSGQIQLSFWIYKIGGDQAGPRLVHFTYWQI